jgi:Zn-finger nucleic acid-binding protein
MEELICPKCQGSMRRYERSGIDVDQCAECRGIFLDRGELEKLMDAEAAFNAPAVAVPRPAAGPGPEYGSPVDDRYAGDRYRDERGRDDRYRDDRYRDDKYRDDRYRDDKYRDKDDRYRSKDGHYDPRKKKRSFLEDLFD